MDKEIQNLKSVLFNTVFDQLCKMLIEDCCPDAIIELTDRLGQIAEQNGYDRRMVVHACDNGFRMIMAEAKANENPERQLKDAEITRMSLRFLACFYMLTQISPRTLEQNETRAIRLAKIPEKHMKQIFRNNFAIFLLLVPDGEIKKELKGEQLKIILRWKKKLESEIA